MSGSSPLSLRTAQETAESPPYPGAAECSFLPSSSGPAVFTGRNSTSPLTRLPDSVSPDPCPSFREAARSDSGGRVSVLSFPYRNRISSSDTASGVPALSFPYRNRTSSRSRISLSPFGVCRLTCQMLLPVRSMAAAALAAAAAQLPVVYPRRSFRPPFSIYSFSSIYPPESVCSKRYPPENHPE